jgi:hypothetical protein
MRVRYNILIRGTLCIGFQEPIAADNFSFQFRVNETSGFVDEIAIEISNVQREKWPTLVQVVPDPHAKIPEFPFRTNPDAFTFKEIEEPLLNLESYLSVFGLEEMDFGRRAEKWIFDDNDEQVGMLSGWSMSMEANHKLHEPLSKEEVISCIRASNSSERETAGLAHFRIGQNHVYAYRNLEAIRHLYMSLEYLFADGHTREKETLKAFGKSQLLVSVITQLFYNPAKPSAPFAGLKQKYPHLLSVTDTPADFLKFLFRLRGDLQHGRRGSPSKWHPSRNGDFDVEALVIMNVAEVICYTITRRRMEASAG